MKFLYYLGLTVIAIWLFTIHTSFAYALNPLTENSFFKGLFVINDYDFKRWVPYCGGLAFSIAITAIIANLKNSDLYFWKFAFAVATLELLGIALFNTPNHGELWRFLAAIYYGLYGFFLTLFYFYVKYDAKEIAPVIELQKPEIAPQSTPAINDEIVQLLKEGLSGVEISKQLNVHPSKVSRINKSLKK
jgi:hypothetical protein